MKAAEIREQTVESLRELQKDLARQLWKARFDNYSNRLDSTAKIPNLRRDIARVATILVEKASGTPRIPKKGAAAEGAAGEKAAKKAAPKKAATAKANAEKPAKTDKTAAAKKPAKTAKAK